MTHRSLRSNGFTIVELLIVVAVIGILAALSFVAYGGITGRATDNAVLSDAETLASLQTDYALDNGTGGKDWYSVNGIDTDLQFTPSGGNVIDIVTNSTDYCIRVYNPASSQYKTLSSAAEKGSSPNSCGTLIASAQAESDSPPSFQTLTWTQQTSLGAGNWRVGDISGNGGTMVAASQSLGMRLSKNAGASWTTVGSVPSSAGSISTTGDTVVLSDAAVSNNNVYVSTNGGTSFTGRTTGGLCCGENVALSGDGTAIVALDDYGNLSVDGGYVYVSLDSGVTWSAKTSMGIDYWRAAAVSEDGTYMLAASNGGRLFTSSNSGSTWTQRTFSGSSSMSWEDAAMSADGQIMYLAASSGRIYKSTNAGVSWTHLTSAGARNWYSMDASSDGIKLVAGEIFGKIFTSVDGGATWQENSPPVDGTWFDIGISSNGTRLIAADSLAGGYIWTGRFQ